MVSGVILYAGRDHGLVNSRRLVLQEEGYAVDVCDDAEEFVRKFLDGDFDLVMLCNSLRDGERERLTSLVHRFSKSTPVLLVCSMPEQVGRGTEHTCTGEPRAILEHVAAALQPSAGRRSARGTAAGSGSPPAQARARTGS